MSADASRLPVHAIRDAFVAALAERPVVLSSPTGSGKSTEVPRWCAGRVLVIEPRRIACRSLAARVAELEGTALGDAVGYLVRDERVAGEATRIVYATPGVALRDRKLLDSASTVILDEFHERGLETDLLLALLLRARRGGLVVMSATLEGERVATHLGGVHLTATGRAFPVELRHLPGRDVLPDASDLPARVHAALRQAEADPGDVLVFLPGKAEIVACTDALRGPFTLVPLHGGLSLDEQRRAFERTSRRKVVLATNVAETSLTIPGIGVVIDTGLVRQTRYHDGRAFLALGPIAEDSAAQRAGRAGRTAPGVCYRLWSPAARLNALTAPEIHREPLASLVLTAAAWGERVEDLPLLDAPTPAALRAARDELAAWGALRADGAVSEGGRAMFALPVEPQHARLLVAAREHGCLDDMVDLVSVLSVGRPLFVAAPVDLAPDDDLRAPGCDATAAIRALRAERASDHAASGFVVQEARLARTRLRRLLGLPDLPPRPAAIDRERLARAAVSADPRLCHVARRHGRQTCFSNGGTELELARESAAHNARELEAVLALDTRAFGVGREARVLVTCAMPVTLALLQQAGLGRDRLGTVQLDRKRVVATIERVYAQRVIGTREEIPRGELARAALAQLMTRGSLFRDAIATTRERLERTALAGKLAARGHPGGLAAADAPPPALEDWLLARLCALGVESGEDLALLSATDFLAPELPYEIRDLIDGEYPSTVSVGDATYRADYDLDRDQVLLRMVKGSRRDPPPLAYLPKFSGLRICVEGPRGVTVLRAGR